MASAHRPDGGQGALHPVERAGHAHFWLVAEAVDRTLDILLAATEER